MRSQDIKPLFNNEIVWEISRCEIQVILIFSGRLWEKGKKCNQEKQTVKKRKRKKKKVKKKKESIFNLYWSLIPFQMGKESHHLPRLWLYQRCWDTSVDLSLHHCVVAFARMLRHFTNLSLHGHIFFFWQDKEERKETGFEARGCASQQCRGVPVVLAAGSLLPSPASDASPPLGQGEAEGLFAIFQFLLFSPAWQRTAVESILSFFTGVKVCSHLAKETPGGKGAKREKRNRPAWPFFGAWNCLRLIARIRRITGGA